MAQLCQTLRLVTITIFYFVVLGIFSRDRVIVPGVTYTSLALKKYQVLKLTSCTLHYFLVMAYHRRKIKLTQPVCRSSTHVWHTESQTRQSSTHVWHTQSQMHQSLTHVWHTQSQMWLPKTQMCFLLTHFCNESTHTAELVIISCGDSIFKKIKLTQPVCRSSTHVRRNQSQMCQSSTHVWHTQSQMWLPKTQMCFLLTHFCNESTPTAELVIIICCNSIF